MNFTTQHQQIALTFLSGIGSKRARLIVAHFNDLDEFFREKKLNLANIPGIPADFVHLKHRVLALQEAEKALDEIIKINGETVFFTEKNYPRRLKQCEDAPLLLYTKGSIDWNAEKIVSVVGTRHATDYGKQLTEELIHGLSEQGCVIVSGMAYGIDICAHQQALKNQLSTWGVLGHGISHMYPSEHRKIAEKMLENGGLISEFHPSLKAEPGHFPMRNRIVAGLADATIVIESGAKGGSLITAQLANDYNRDVFAFPGDINRPYSKGCLHLLRENKATLICNSTDFITSMSWEHKTASSNAQRQLFVEVNEREQRILDILKEKKQLTSDSIGFLSLLTASEVSSELLGLEFKGLVRSLPGRRFELV